MRVIPVAGYDSMLLNLAGAHAPHFTRTLVLLKDNAGHTGIGEVPGGAGILRALERSAALVVGTSIAPLQSHAQRDSRRDRGQGRRAPAPGDLGR